MPKPLTSQRDSFEEKIARVILDGIKTRSAPWLQQWVPGTEDASRPVNAVNSLPFRGPNRLLLGQVAAARGYDDPRWLTYQQAASLDAQVKKGERATQLIIWQFTKEVAKVDQEGKAVHDERGNQVTETVQLQGPRAFVANVFNAAQCNNMPDLVRPALPSAELRLSKAEAILRTPGVAIVTGPVAAPIYDQKQDRIVAPALTATENALQATASTLHELCHATGHATRLNRDMTGGYGSTAYAREELRSQIASLMLCQEIGLPHVPTEHEPYVELWTRALEEDPREILRAAADAQQIVDMCLQSDQQRSLTTAVSLTPGDRTPPSSDPPPADSLDANKPDASRRTEVAVSTQTHTYLAVPFNERNEARAAGARWDVTHKSWYLPQGGNEAAIRKWLPRQDNSVARTTIDFRDEFRAFAERLGADLTGTPKLNTNGQIERIPIQGAKKGSKDGAYKLYSDGIPAGWFKNFQTGEVHKFVSARSDIALTPQQRADLHNEASTRKKMRAEEREIAYRQHAVKAAAYFEKLRPALADHQYLKTKQIGPHDLRLDPYGNLVAPLRNAANEISTLQIIKPDGEKKFRAGGQVEGHFAVIGSLKDAPTVVVAEGYATAASIHETTKLPVAVAFVANNLAAVATALWIAQPGIKLIFAADNDRFQTKDPSRNPGLEAAQAAAETVHGIVAVPYFAAAESRGTDWNDLLKERGAAEFTTQFRRQVGLLLPAPSNTHEKGRDLGRGMER